MGVPRVDRRVAGVTIRGAMDRATLSTIGHQGLPFSSPVSVADLDALLAAADLPHRPHVLDLGCGDGGMLAYVVARLDGSGVGVDHSGVALDRARARAGRLQFVEGDLTRPPPGAFDLTLLVGALPESGFAAVTIPSPRLLLGELVRVGPAPAIPGLPDVARLDADVADAGWSPVHAPLLGEEALRAYERTWISNVRAYTDAHPGEDLSGVLAAHEALLEAGGLGFRLGVWVR